MRLTMALSSYYRRLRLKVGHQYPNGAAVNYLTGRYGCRVPGESGEGNDRKTRSLRSFAAPEMPPLALPYPHEVLFGPDP